VQILTGFLLTVPFTTRFPDLDALQRYAYLAVLVGSVIATGLIVGPVAFHRILFRQGERPWLVAAANHSARAGLAFLALTTSGVVWLVFSVVIDRTAGSIAMGAALLFFLTLWTGIPLIARYRD
jgi:hypothetical protein